MSDKTAVAESGVGRYGSGREVRRVEDPALVRGQGMFTDDVAPAGQVHLVFLRSPHAHARIVAIDADAARAMPGVLSVLSGADLVAAGVGTMAGPPPVFKRADGSPAASPKRHPLAVDRVRFVGEPVLAIVAETRDAARDAADSIFVEYEELAAVADPIAAIQPGAAVVCDDAPDNRCAEMRHGDRAATDAGFAAAAHKVEVDIVNQRLIPLSLEPRMALAWIDEAGRLTIRSSTQAPTAIRDGVVGALPGLGSADVRVVVGDVGGGFGMKTGCYAEDVVVAHAARTLKRPVKWRGERSEDFLAAFHGRDLISHAEMALDADGRVLGLRVRTVANVGAYPNAPGTAIALVVGPFVATSIYDIRAIDLDLTTVITNTTPVGAYRGAGRPEAIYLIERLMDAAAREMRMDPAELRRRNMIRPEQMPYRTAMNQVYDVGRFEQILDQALALADWNGFAARRESSQARGRLRGRGLASFLEWTGGNALHETVAVRVAGDGFIELDAAVQGMGQGIITSLTQLAVDVFDVEPERIRILLGDTDRANGFGSAGSRSLFTGGSALTIASRNTLDKARDLAADALEAPAADLEYASGRFRVAGTDLGIGLFDLAARQTGGRIEGNGEAKAGAPSWPNASHVCEVEIDPVTGEVEIVAYASVNDIGRIVSPVIVRGQVDGGAVQGIGQALCEKVVYDPESGQALSASLLDYAVPRADGFIGFKTAFDSSIPCTTNALGVKGVGELGTIGATPAVVLAVVDALAAAGQGRAAERVQMPLTGEVVWRALNGDYPKAIRLP